MDFIKISISIPKEVKEKLEKMAKKEMRSVSNMIAFLIEDFSKK